LKLNRILRPLAFSLVLLAMACPVSAQETEPIEEDDEIVVTGTKTKKLLKETPVKTEVVTRKEIERTGATTLTEALAHKTGVRVDNQCSICNATSIQLSGLPGRYTLLLIDGFPVFSSLGQTYGMLNVEAAQIERIEIVKGASSILYGTDAIGGVVNVITRAPGKHDFATMTGQYGSYNSYRLSGAASVSRNRLAALITMAHATHDSIDRDGNGISEYAGYARTTGSATLRWKAAARTAVLLRLAAAQETRQGGGMGSFISVLTDPERRALTESVLTRRLEAGVRVEHGFTKDFDGHLLAGYTWHDQDSDYEGELYRGKQHIVIAQGELVGRVHPKVELIGGIPYRLEMLDENLAEDDYHHHMVGAFLQADWHALEAFEVVGGFRYDYHTEYGSVYTPRVALKYAASPWLTLRTGFGTGFRAPTTFYEYAHGVRPEGYTLKNDADRAETSMTATLSATFDAGKYLNATLEGAWTRVADPIAVEVTDAGDVATMNMDGTLQVISAEAQLRSAPLRWLGLEAGYGYYHYRDEAGALATAPPSQQITAGFDFNAAKVGFKASVGLDVFAPMDLEAVYGEGYNIKPAADSVTGWTDETNADLDSPKRSTSPWYSLVNVRAQQRLARGLYLYAGVDNLLDMHQADNEGPLYFPAADDGSATPADVVYIWGPMRGRYVYGGLKVDF